MARLFSSRTRTSLPAAMNAWVLVLVLLVLAFMVLVVLPWLLYRTASCSLPLDSKRPCTGLTAPDQATARNAVRSAGAATLLALGAVWTAFAALRTYQVNQQGHVTGRYKDAVAHLGEDKLAVRLGGIYALERLMKDSPDDQPTILEVLAAFIRHPPADPRLAEPRPRAEDARLPHGGVAPGLLLREDVQASLTVIGRRTTLSTERPMGLSEAHLDGADLVGARLEGADLTGAHLEGAHLKDAHLNKADLTGAYLEGAGLKGAQLVEAVLSGAFVTGADLTSAYLDKANLSGAQLRFGTLLARARLRHANLTSAHLEGADLSDADLVGAILSDADLGGVQGLSQEQLDTAVGNVNTKLPDGCIRPITWST